MLLRLYDIRRFVAIIAIAIIIKLIDDYIDLEEKERSKFIKKMDRGILSYVLIFYTVSVILEYNTSITFMISAYIVGMIKDCNRALSFKLKGWQESILVFMISVLVVDLKELVSSLVIIVLCQLIDDYIDRRNDRIKGYFNLVNKFGKVEVLLSITILVLLSIKFDILKLLMSLIVFTLIEFYDYKKLGESKWI